MNRDTLVSWFIANYPQYYKDMFSSNHCVELDKPNIFHAEGTVWTHTMMVMTWIMARHSLNNDVETEQKNDTYTILLTSALLHDLGKPVCEEINEPTETKPLRNSFKGHEGVSVMLCIGVLKHLQKDFPEYYTDEVIEYIIKVVGTHGVALDGEDNDPYLYSLRNSFRIADKRGAIRQVDEDIFSQYSKRKFAQRVNPQPDKEIVFMVGLPCSGKSTLIKEECCQHDEYVILSRDNALLEFYEFTLKKPEGDLQYSDVYKYIHNDETLKTDFEKYFEDKIRMYSQNIDKVIVDMTMMPMSSRRKMMNKFPKHKRKAVVVMTDWETIQKRNLERFELESKNIPESVFLNMAKSFTYPVLEEGFEDIKLVIN